MPTPIVVDIVTELVVVSVVIQIFVSATRRRREI